jgi:hypothetical protein
MRIHILDSPFGLHKKRDRDRNPHFEECSILIEAETDLLVASVDLICLKSRLSNLMSSFRVLCF